MRAPAIRERLRPSVELAASTVAVVAAVLLALVVATPLGAQKPRATQTASTSEKPMQAELAMMQEESAFRTTLDAFLATAAKGDAARVEQMISPNLRRQAGSEAVANVVRTQVLPFFANFAGMGAVTITRTTDQFGNQGFTYYSYARSPEGETRPFVAYLVEENGTTVVANILVDRYVEGRHP